jgi:hypothetical protein
MIPFIGYKKSSAAYQAADQGCGGALWLGGLANENHDMTFRRFGVHHNHNSQHKLTTESHFGFCQTVTSCEALMLTAAAEAAGVHANLSSAVSGSASN